MPKRKDREPTNAPPSTPPDTKDTTEPTEAEAQAATARELLAGALPPGKLVPVMVPLDQLIEWPGNARDHNEAKTNLSCGR